MAKYAIGVDDATRCPVIGSLVVCAIKIPRKDLRELLELGIKDSKQLTRKQRERWKDLFVEREYEHHYMLIKPSLLDSDNLNDLECEAYYELIAELDPKNSTVYIDNFERDREHFVRRAAMLGYYIPDSWVIEHDADKKYPAVAAASIVAKCVSDEEYDLLKEKHGDFGSGNPNDKKTLKWICEHPESEIIRKKWKTYKWLEKHHFNYSELEEINFDRKR